MKGTSRPSDHAPGPVPHKKPSPLDIECPVCHAAPEVRCCTSGTHHTKRVKAWRAAQEEPRTTATEMEMRAAELPQGKPGTPEHEPGSDEPGSVAT